MNKMTTFFAVLALIAATLATIPASAYTALVGGRWSQHTNLFYAAERNTREEALIAARQACDNANIVPCSANDSEKMLTADSVYWGEFFINMDHTANRCIAVATHSDGVRTSVFVGFGVGETFARHDAENDQCETNGGNPDDSCEIPTDILISEDNNALNKNFLCDGNGVVCGMDETAINEYGECCPMGTHEVANIPIERDDGDTAFIERCVEICTDDNNNIRSTTDPTACTPCADDEEPDDNNMMCEKRCLGTDDGVRDGAGGCMTCGDNREDLGAMCGNCVAGFEELTPGGECVAECKTNERRNASPDNMCVCDGENETVQTTNGEECLPKCSEEQNRLPSGACVAKPDETLPTFSFSATEGFSGAGTEDAPYEVTVSLVGNISVEIRASEGDFVYAKDSGSDELAVSEAGIVSFITNSVAADDYDIIVIAESDSVTVAISVYFSVSENDDGDGEGDGEGGDGEGGDDSSLVVEPLPTLPNVGGEGTNAVPYEVMADSVADFMFTVEISEGSGNYGYAKDARSSPQLDVDPNSGLIAFNVSVVANDRYSIIVIITDQGEDTGTNSSANANGGNVVAAAGDMTTVAVYIQVAETEPSSGDTGNDGEIVERPTPNSNKENRKLALGVSSGVAVFVAYYVIANFIVDLNWTPSYAFQHRNGNLSYAVGSRWTATADNWRFYWQTRQNGNIGDDGQLVYGSGMNYNNGIVAAAFNSTGTAEQTDLDLSLSATKAAGLWQLNSGYNFALQMSDTETDTQNRLNVAARYVMDKWILSANANTNGNRATAGINYSYRF